ncbi:MAG: iron uptake porin [Cyanobacteria bacterium]|nr:iron uptake porin [Cyanobacteriota bacterium]MDW8202359.1 iron uptake porin [Cyanobacteriota bacterium SKYGB_h_bin112]
MSKTLLRTLVVSPALLGAFVAVSSTAIAAEAPDASKSALHTLQAASSDVTTVQPMVPAPQAPEMLLAQTFSGSATVPTATPADNGAVINQLSRYGSEGRPNPMAQVTSVSQLSDVQPTDWAYQSLQSLVERYGCIVGYPDGTFRGNRPLSRFEFAAGLNACMDKVSELIAQGTANLVSKDDLAALQKLQEEFSAELATLRGRVDALEARTATLEAQQFSTTTKLSGEAIFAITDNFGGTNGVPEFNTVFLNRVRLNFLTSFTGKDTLWTRFQTGNFQAAPLSGIGDFQSGQTFDLGNFAGDSRFILDTLNYTFPVGDKLKIAIEANAGYWPDLIPTLNPFFEDFDGGQGSLSLFGQRNPIYRIVDGTGAGILFSYDFTDAISLSGGYMANVNAANPIPGKGLFNGSYAALAQLTFRPSDKFGIGLTYNRGYFNNDLPLFGTVGTGVANIGVGTYTTDSFGVSATWTAAPWLTINGWFNYTKANATAGGATADIYSYAIGLAFPDLGKKGNLGGILVGAQPYAASSTFTGLPANNATPFHIEGFYRYQLTDNISITPGVIWLTAPGQTSTTDDVIIGTLRTTFLF